MKIRRASVVTHNDPAVTSAALAHLIELAGQLGVELVAANEEIERHGLAGSAVSPLDATEQPDLCICLGGDGTILRGLRANTRNGVPVFGLNFGEVGFLAAADPSDDGTERPLSLALSRDWETLDLPGLEIVGREDLPLAFNDVALQRRPGLRVADIAYLVGDEEVGRVRCDGVVLCTPAGSTGYNLANGGPVMAWGVEGYTVSFIAPHSLTARALVVAPGDVASVVNRSRTEPVDLAIDGRPVGELAAGERISIRFSSNAGILAQASAAGFYHRLREKFGRLAT